MAAKKKNYVDGATLRFHEYSEPMNLTQDEIAKIRHFFDETTDAELILGERRFMRVSRRGFVAVEWNYVHEQGVSYALMGFQLQPSGG